MADGDGMVRTGADVLEGACDYIRARESFLSTCDLAERSKTIRRLALIRGKVAEEVKSEAARGAVIVEDSCIDEAMKNIKVSKSCKSVPLAAIVINLLTSRAWHREAQGLCLDLGLAIGHEETTDVYHSLKPHKSQSEYGSFRTFTLNLAEGRLQ